MADTSFTYADSPEAFVALHRLTSCNLPPSRLRALFAQADGSPVVALSLPKSVLTQPPIGLTDKQYERFSDALTIPLPLNLSQTANALGVRAITTGDPAYPRDLLPFPNAPSVLFVRGTLTANALSAAIVGSRRATLYGRGQAERFAAALAEAGVVVVSGGAAGIDTTAHKATLVAGGITVAVLGCGPDYSYPSENKALFAQIVERGGAVISEYPIGTTPEPYRFPARNRIIAALSKATIVIESPEDSGALITARCAAEYGRAVLAVPGAVDTGRSRGCHELIRDGATIADTPDDVFLALGLPLQNGKVAQAVLPIDSPPVPPAARKKAVTVMPAAPKPAVLPAPFAAAPVSDVVELQVSVPLLPNEQKFLMQLSSTPRHLDDVAVSAELSASDAGVAAIFLEMKSLVRRLPGNLFVRP